MSSQASSSIDVDVSPGYDALLLHRLPKAASRLIPAHTNSSRNQILLTPRLLRTLPELSFPSLYPPLPILLRAPVHLCFLPSLPFHRRYLGREALQQRLRGAPVPVEEDLLVRSKECTVVDRTADSVQSWDQRQEAENEIRRRTRARTGSSRKRQSALACPTGREDLLPLLRSPLPRGDRQRSRGGPHWHRAREDSCIHRRR